MAQQLPQKYGKYILLRKIAMGGMAEIFRAKTVGAEGFEKIIVIKRILPHYTDDEAFVKMFIDEARIASKLQHSNVVQIYDFDTIDDRYYIAMEYVEGADLKSCVERGLKSGNPMSPAQCAWIMMEISKGLHYAHQKEDKGQPLNIVHRDISPHNVMMSFAGEAKLMDFGIAKAAQRSTKTMAGTVKGKCAYMSPEQARGKPLDGRSDLFALGIMLWEMLTHKRLFLGDSDFETLSNVLKADVPPPSSVNPSVPAALDAIVLKALSKDRDQRHKSVEAFGRDLTKWFYSTVNDLDLVALKPYLKKLFAEDINTLRAEYAEEQGMEVVDGRATTASATDAVASEPAGPPAPGDRTVALPMDSDPQAAKTLMDGALNQAQLQEALAKQRAASGGAGPPSHDNATVALPSWGGQQPGTGNFQQQTGAFQQGHTGTFAGSTGGPNPLLIALAALVLLGAGGAAAWYFLAGQNTTPTQQQVQKAPSTKGVKAAGKAVLILKVDPYTAKVTADGKAVDGKVEGLHKGDKIRLVAEAPGYKRLEEIVTITSLQNEASLKMKKVDVEMAIVIKPSDNDAIVWAGGKKLGTGAQTYQGVEGDFVELAIYPAGGGDAVKRKVKLSQDQPVVEIDMPKTAAVAALGSITVTVDPSDAVVTASVGTVAKQGDAWVVAGVPLGTDVRVTAKKSGLGTDSESVTVTGPSHAVSLEIKKKVVATGPGTLKINAKPWAKVTVDGSPKGTTPVTVGSIKSGKHKVTLTKGSQSKSFSVTVQPGKTKKVFHDFAQ